MHKSLIAFCLMMIAIHRPTLAEPSIQWGVTISSGGAPPPAVWYEPPPPPRPAHVWVRGYWAWDGSDYRWVPGRWERARVGYVYVQPEWMQGPQGWQFRQGGWQDDQGRDREDSHKRDHCPPGHRRKGDC